MRGPRIITESMSSASIVDEHGNSWQYQSQSDNHSKIACWAIAFDLLAASPTLRAHVTAGRVTFGINRRMNDFEQDASKDFDLVIARASAYDPSGEAPKRTKSPRAFDLMELAERFGVELTSNDRAVLHGFDLPPAPAGMPGATTLVALEAKACMTKHVGALPRLSNELTSSFTTIHGDTQSALAVGFVMINAATRFISPASNRRKLTAEQPAKWSRHTQPHASQRAMDMLGKIRRRSGPQSSQAGFDALGAILIDMANDGSRVAIMSDPPSPQPGDTFYYDNMISRIAQLYENTYGTIL